MATSAKKKKFTKKDFFALKKGVKESKSFPGVFYYEDNEEYHLYVLAKIYENGPYCLFFNYCEADDIDRACSEEKENEPYEERLAIYADLCIEEIVEEFSKFKNSKTGFNHYLAEDKLIGFVEKGIAYINADEWTDRYRNGVVNPNAEENMIGFSFSCVLELDPKGIQKLASGEIKITDYTDESKISIKSQAEARKLIDSQKGSSAKLKPPGKGYSIVMIDYKYCWHKSGHVLMQDIQKEMTYLMGQDEGQYFGVELADYCNSIESAIESLKPPEVKGIKNVLRQGEWFLLPVKESEVPSIKDSVLWVNEGNSYNLPKDTPESNTHTLDFDEIRISQDGKVYSLNPNLNHNEHTELSWKGWARFVKNTAVRSVSVDGVD